MPPPGIQDPNLPVAESTTIPVAVSTTIPVASAANVAECRLPDRAIDSPYNYWRLGIPRRPGFAPSLGTIHVTVLFVDYSDARATRTPQDVFAQINSASISQFFSDVSYGSAQLDIQPFPKWLNLQQSSTEKGRDFLDESYENRRVYFQEAITVADPEFDFSETDIILVVRNPDAADASGATYSVAEDSLGFQVDGTSIRAAVVIGEALLPNNEENIRNNFIANQFVGAMAIPSPLFGSDVSDDFVVRGSTVGAFGVRGNNWDTQHAPGPFAFERWQLGWLQDDQIICHKAGEQTVELSAIENAGGAKAVIVPLGDSCGLVVESRRAIGTDSKLVKQGALVYTVNTGVDMSIIPRVYGMPIRVLPANDNDLNRDQAPLALGESLTYSNITVTNVAERADGDTVQVTINGPVSCDVDVASATVQTGSAPAAAVTAPAASLPPQTAACGLDKIPAPKQGNATIRFINESGYEAVGFWEDASKTPPQRLEYFRLQNGNAYIQETFTGDRWIIQDPTGGVLMEYTVSSDQKQCVLIKRPLGTSWVDFINQSGVPAIGYLVDANGNIVEYFRVGVGGVAGLWTAPGLTWRVLDANGNVLLNYTATSAPTQQAIIPPLLATATPNPASTQTPVQATATSALPFQVPLDANNCPVIKNATQVICYDITGSTQPELVAAMKALTPKSPDWYGVDAHFSWTWDASCTPSSLNVTLDYQKPFFPRWTPPGNASPGLIAKWQNYIQIQAVRAQMEVDYINQHYLEVKTAILNAMKQDPSCSTANAAGQQAIDTLYNAAWASIDQTVPRPKFP
jgi:predicted secreted Zn-dependent protease